MYRFLTALLGVVIFASAPGAGSETYWIERGNYLLEHEAVPDDVPEPLRLLVIGHRSGEPQAAEKAIKILSQVAADPLSYDEDVRRAAVACAWKFRLQEAVPDLLKMASDLGKSSDLREANRGYFRELILYSLAHCRDPQAENVLSAALREPEIEEGTKFHIAAGLVAMDLQAGRDFLLDRLDGVLAGRDSSSNTMRTLRALADEALRESVAEIAERLPDAGWRVRLNDVVERMRFNGTKLDAVRAALDDAAARLEAVIVLGERGGLHDMNRLNALRLVHAGDEATTRAIDGAILTIKHRLWRERR